MGQITELLPYCYLALMGLIGFAMMGIDKRRAKRKEWRISERMLLIQAFLGGSIGSLLGMYVYHHKTKHMKFVLLVPIAVIVDLAAVVGFMKLF